jgi:uncharacterized protein YoxC
MPTDTQKIPNPIYAAAGAGDLVIERLRKLPERVAVLQERANTLQDELPGRLTKIQDKVTQKVAELPSIVAELRQRAVDADGDKLRETARRNAGVVVASAQAAQERAAAMYAELVARGERVVSGTPAPRPERIVAEIVPAESTTTADTAAKAEPVAKAETGETAAKAAKAAAAKADKPESKRTAKPRKTS